MVIIEQPSGDMAVIVARVKRAKHKKMEYIGKRGTYRKYMGTA
jgi:hypothetical protein